jgi:hypothetical protein
MGSPEYIALEVVLEVELSELAALLLAYICKRHHLLNIDI